MHVSLAFALAATSEQALQLIASPFEVDVDLPSRLSSNQ